VKSHKSVIKDTYFFIKRQTQLKDGVLFYSKIKGNIFLIVRGNCWGEPSCIWYDYIDIF